MFSMVIVEISAESVKACSFHQRKSIPDTEIIYSTSSDWPLSNEDQASIQINPHFHALNDLSSF
jgi:hypothetical protein